MQALIHSLVTLILSIWICFPAHAAKLTETAQPAKKSESQKSDYQRMKMMRVMDREGWGEPVEAFRLLIPSEWKTDGWVRLPEYILLVYSALPRGD